MVGVGDSLLQAVLDDDLLAIARIDGARADLSSDYTLSSIVCLQIRASS